MFKYLKFRVQNNLVNTCITSKIENYSFVIEYQMQCLMRAFPKNTIFRRMNRK